MNKKRNNHTNQKHKTTETSKSTGRYNAGDMNVCTEKDFSLNTMNVTYVDR